LDANLRRISDTRTESGTQGLPPQGMIAGKTGRKAMIFRAALNKVLEKRHGAAHAEVYR
jgi:hypothetical protein